MTRIRYLAHFLDYHFGQRAGCCAQRECDLYSFRTILGAVHKPQIDDVHPDFRIVTPFRACNTSGLFT